MYPEYQYMFFQMNILVKFLIIFNLTMLVVGFMITRVKSVKTFYKLRSILLKVARTVNCGIVACMIFTVISKALWRM